MHNVIDYVEIYIEGIVHSDVYTNNTPMTSPDTWPNPSLNPLTLLVYNKKSGKPSQNEVNETKIPSVTTTSTDIPSSRK